MTKTYSRRLLLPFVGMVQIVEMEKARALSMDGNYWSLQYRLPVKPQAAARKTRADPGSTYTRIMGYQHAAVGTITGGKLENHPVPPFLDADTVRSANEELFSAVSAAILPFPAADRYEYWLLDARDRKPLALLFTSMDAQDPALAAPRSEWIPMPASELKVEPPEAPDDGFYVPPVNYRLERMVAERAGSKPQAAWFERSDVGSDDFPECLISEDWPEPQQHELCQRYLRRLAPRLLMLQGLSSALRQRLELAAREHVFEIERFFSLYPEVVDQQLLTAARVEARMRRANG